MVLEPHEICFRYDASHKLTHKDCVQKRDREHLLTNEKRRYCPVAIATSKRHKLRTLSECAKFDNIGDDG